MTAGRILSEETGSQKGIPAEVYPSEIFIFDLLVQVSIRTG